MRENIDFKEKVVWYYQEKMIQFNNVSNDLLL